jgi:hypothetical protein
MNLQKFIVLFLQAFWLMSFLKFFFILLDYKIKTII